MSQLYIGTSGWSTSTGKIFFILASRKKNGLKFYAARFATVEINSTFYRMQTPDTFSRWLA